MAGPVGINCLPRGDHEWWIDPGFNNLLCAFSLPCFLFSFFFGAACAISRVSSSVPVVATASACSFLSIFSRWLTRPQEPPSIHSIHRSTSPPPSPHLHTRHRTITYLLKRSTRQSINRTLPTKLLKYYKKKKDNETERKRSCVNPANKTPKRKTHIYTPRSTR